MCSPSTPCETVEEKRKRWNLRKCIVTLFQALKSKRNVLVKHTGYSKTRNTTVEKESKLRSYGKCIGKCISDSFLVLKSQRQMLARHNEGIHLTDVYAVHKILGHGSMGAVSLVEKKVDAFSKVKKSTSHNNLPDDIINTASERMRSSPAKTLAAPSLYACKTVNTVRFSDYELQEFVNEVDILRDLDHPSIVQLYEVFRVKRKVWIILELCLGGDLTDRVKYMNEADTLVVLEQVLCAVVYMHERNVCHRDIKLENIMFANESPESPIKLIDFGLSNKFTKGMKIQNECGTIYTAAPELFLGQGCTEKTDIWSIGVVAFVLLSKNYPFLKNKDDLNDPIKRENFENANFTFGDTWKERNISDFAKVFVKNCLCKLPNDRWNARDALSYLQKTWTPYLENLWRPTTVSNRQIQPLPQTHSEMGGIEFDMNPDEYNQGIACYEILSRLVTSKRKRIRMNSHIFKCMNNFALYGELKKTILMTMAYSMDKRSLQELSDIFSTMDTNGFGTLSLLDLKRALSQVISEKHLNDTIIEKLFRGIDVDNSGQIHYNEFLAAVVESQGLITMEHLAEAFDRIDADGKGFISRDDLKSLLGTNYKKEVVDKMIEEADYKKNNQIDYDEFLRLMFADPATGYKNVGNISTEDKSMIEQWGHIFEGGRRNVLQ